MPFLGGPLENKLTVECPESRRTTHARSVHFDAPYIGDAFEEVDLGTVAFDGVNSALQVPRFDELGNSCAFTEVPLGSARLYSHNGANVQTATSEDHLRPLYGIPSVELPGLCVEHEGMHDFNPTLTDGSGAQPAWHVPSSAEDLERYCGGGAHLPDVPAESAHVECVSVDADYLVDSRLDLAVAATAAGARFKDACAAIEQVPADAGGGPCMR